VYVAILKRMSAARIDSLLVAISVGEDLGSTMLTSTLNQKSLLTVLVNNIYGIDAQ
jgi:hypothetical protein